MIWDRCIFRVDALRRGIGFIHQELNVFDNLDVASNVFLGREPSRWGFLRLIDRERMYREARYARLYDGLDVLHRMVVARTLSSADPSTYTWS